MQNDGYHSYCVEFQYKQKTYVGEFKSTVKITPQTNRYVAWDLASDCINSVLSKIPNRVKGGCPYDIYISGEFGTIKVD